MSKPRLKYKPGAALAAQDDLFSEKEQAVLEQQDLIETAALGAADASSDDAPETLGGSGSSQILPDHGADSGGTPIASSGGGTTPPGGGTTPPGGGTTPPGGGTTPPGGGTTPPGGGTTPPFDGGGGGGNGGGPLPPLPADADHLPLGLYAERAYLDYAVSVVKGRALPEVSDGQKPVQRRILYAMNEMGLGANAKPVKSARVVGDVIGKYHPHGDQSAYDAMVRMAQDFSLRYPLIDGQGNFGSRDGDNAAAYRYTEARLTPIARLLLDEIDMGTVDFIPNYEGTFQEPRQLPARLPMVLLNGASGIAVGMATEIPSHNLREVAKAAIAVLRKPKITTAELLEIMPGPDFPGGGQLISSTGEIREAYESGRGSLKVRARWQIEELARGQWQAVVTELPPGTSTQKVLEEIEELTNPKLRPGKKSLTPEQQNIKALILSVLDVVRDESGKDADVRLVFEPKTAKIDQQEFMTTLLAHTGMESSASLNMVMIGIDGRPRQKPLKDVIAEWAGFRVDTVTRRIQFRLGKVDDRIHILEGRMIVYLNIDKVIRIIRESDEPKAGLVKAFKLSDRQAEDILDIRLRQLARLEGIKIEQELKELKNEKKELEFLLGDEGAMKKLVIKEIEADAKQFGDNRRTLIEEAGKSVITQTVVDEPVTVIFSEKGWVRARSGHGHDATLFTFKEGDGLYGAFECRTVDHVLLFGSNGRVYSVGVGALPGARGDGVPVTTLIDLEAGTRILHMLAGPGDQAVLVAATNGYGFACKVADMLSRTKGGKAFIRMDASHEPVRPALIAPDHLRVAVMGSGQRLLVFKLNEVSVLAGGGRGVILQELDLKEKLLAVSVFGTAGLMVEGAGRGGKEFNVPLEPRALKPYEAKRARKGKLLVEKIKAAGLRPL